MDLATARACTVTSLNIQTAGVDAAAVSVQAALRGLSPNDTLVLVNGKVVFKHPYGISPWGGDGGFYYGRLTYTF